MTRAALVDLFAGAGGLSAGMEMAGAVPVMVSEIHPHAMATYMANRRDAHGLVQVADICEVTRSQAELGALARRLRAEHGDISVVAGGPPCQGYTRLGYRRSFDITRDDIPSNHLYREMATFISSVGPRAFVFENVRGVVHAKWTPSGDRGEIWEDINKAFSEVVTTRPGGRRCAYRIESSVVHAHRYGVPQNRPRVLMVGVREDIDLGSGGLIPDHGHRGPAPGVAEALGDLVDDAWVPGGRTTEYPRMASNWFQEMMREGSVGLVDHEYSNHGAATVAKFQHMLDNDGQIPEEAVTKKFLQRVLPREWDGDPTITVTSLPDDFVHFSQPRTPTVREWARLQTFPDRYMFCGKRTTGGRTRAGDPDKGVWERDLPKYTQIGNAVPVFMAEAVLLHLKELGACLE